MLREDPEEKVVRVLRSWKLRSKNAPKAGLRYDGLYRILSFSVHLSPPNTWHTAFTLSRLPTQPSLLEALHIPTSDQLDDWKDYQRLKIVDRGDDFAMLREILSRGEEMGDGEGLNDGRHGSEDSGYFSRRSSKAISTGDGRRDSIFMEELGEMIQGIGREDVKDDDEEAEEADDEGAGLEDLEEEDEQENDYEKQEGVGVSVKGDDDQAEKEGIARPTNQPETPEHVKQAYSQTRIVTRFISARKPAEPRVSADEAVVARPRYPVVRSE